MKSLDKKPFFEEGLYENKTDTVEVYVRHSFGTAEQAVDYLASLDVTEPPAGSSNTIAFDNLATAVAYETNTKSIATAAENAGLSKEDGMRLANALVRDDPYSKANIAATVQAKRMLDEYTDKSTKYLTKGFREAGEETLLKVIDRVPAETDRIKLSKADSDKDMHFLTITSSKKGIDKLKKFMSENGELL